MREDAKLKRLKTILTAIGENGANLKVLMEALQRKDRKGFVSTYITPPQHRSRLYCHAIPRDSKPSDAIILLDEQGQRSLE